MRPKSEPMLRSWVLYGLALSGALVFHVFYTGWFSWYVLVFLAGLPAFSLLVSLPAMRRFRFSLTLPERCARAEAAQLSFQAQSSRWPVPVYRVRLCLRDEMGAQAFRRVFLSAGLQKLALPIRTEHSGAMVCALERLTVYDYLGLFGKRLPQPPEKTLLVLPQPQPPRELPNLGAFQFRSYRPKYGGGFSEQHELREYRPGDSLRDVHWKLSAKTGELIVREAQEPNRGQVVLSFDLSADRAEMDRTLDQLLWLSQWLSAHEVPHQIDFPDTLRHEFDSVPIPDASALEPLVVRLLHLPLTQPLPSIAGKRYPQADWRCHIAPGEGKEARV